MVFLLKISYNLIIPVPSFLHSLEGGSLQRQEQDAKTGWTSNQSYHIPPETFRKLMNLIYMSYFDTYEMSVCSVMGNVIRVVVFTLSIIQFSILKDSICKRMGLDPSLVSFKFV